MSTKRSHIIKLAAFKNTDKFSIVTNSINFDFAHYKQIFIRTLQKPTLITTFKNFHLCVVRLFHLSLQIYSGVFCY